MKLKRTIGILLALALLGLAMTAAPARAEILFTPPQFLQTSLSPAQAVTDSQGRLTIVWDAPAKGGSFRLVRTVRLDANGVPGPVHTLATVPNPDDWEVACICPQVAVDPAGRATAVWQTFDAEVRRIQSAQIDPMGIPDPPQVVSPRFLNAWDPQLAVDKEGWVTIVYKAYETEGPKVRIEAVRLDPEGTRGEPQVVAEEGSQPRVAVGPDGTAHISWSAKVGVDTTTLDAEGTLGEVQTVTPPDEDGGASNIIVDSKGRATISWWRGGGFYEAKAVRLEADGTPGTVWTLSPPDREVGEPKLAVDPQDRVTAVWDDFKESVWAVRLGADGVPGTVHNLSGEGTSAGTSEVAAAADGRVVVVWAHMPYPHLIPEKNTCHPNEYDPEHDVVRAAFIAADGQPEAVYDVSAYGQQALEPKFGLDPQGLPRIAWISFDGTYGCWDDHTRLHTSRATLVNPPVVEPPPEPEPPVKPPTPPPPPEKALLRLAKKAVVKNGRVVLRAKCIGGPGTACAGKLELSLRPRATLARGRYRLAGGESRKLSLRLSGHGKQLIGSGQQQFSAKAKGRDIAADVVLVRLPRPR